MYYHGLEVLDIKIHKNKARDSPTGYLEKKLCLDWGVRPICKQKSMFIPAIDFN